MTGMLGSPLLGEAVLSTGGRINVGLDVINLALFVIFALVTLGVVYFYERRYRALARQVARISNRPDGVEKVLNLLGRRADELFGPHATREDKEAIDKHLFDLMDMVCCEEPTEKLLQHIRNLFEGRTATLIAQRSGPEALRIDEMSLDYACRILTYISVDPARVPDFSKEVSDALLNAVVTAIHTPPKTPQGMRFSNELYIFLTTLLAAMRQELSLKQPKVREVADALLGFLHRIATNPDPEEGKALRQNALGVLIQILTKLGENLEGDLGQSVHKAMQQFLEKTAENPDPDTVRDLRNAARGPVRDRMEIVAQRVRSGEDAVSAKAVDDEHCRRLIETARNPDAATAESMQPLVSRTLVQRMETVTAALPSDESLKDCRNSIDLSLADKLRETAQRPNPDTEAKLASTASDGLIAYFRQFMAALREVAPELAKELDILATELVRTHGKAFSEDPSGVAAKVVSDSALERLNAVLKETDFSALISAARSAVEGLTNAPLGDTEQAKIEQTVREGRFTQIAEIAALEMQSEPTRVRLAQLTHAHLDPTLEKVVPELLDAQDVRSLLVGALVALLRQYLPQTE